jgi:hypothetical protein
MDGQLRDLLDAAVGEPPHHVTVEAVRRRVVRRRVMESVTGAACLAVMAGLGVAVAGQVLGPRTGGGSALQGHPPAYYLQQTEGLAGKTPAVKTMVRATRTGAVTDTVRCPWPEARVPARATASAGNKSFFIVCERSVSHGERFIVTGSRVYRFRLTKSGRIAGYSLVPGGALGPRRVYSISAAPGGGQLAVASVPGSVPFPARSPADLYVINTQNGSRAVWHGGKEVPDAAELTFTDQGLALAFVTDTPCGPAKKAKCRELREISRAATGGQLDSSRLILRFSALALTSADYINDVVISPDGSSLIAADVYSGAGRGGDSVKVIKFSVATGKRMKVIYQLHTGNGFFYQFFGADPTGRYLLFNAGPTTATVNGWIYRGRLVQLKPANGNDVPWETW